MAWPGAGQRPRLLRAAAEAFSDPATLGHMLRFEAALAEAAAEAGLIPRRAAPVIVEACDPALYDPAALAEAARRTATLTVPVVKALTDEVARRDAEAAGYVHWGATSQDVIDTAMVLQLGEALPPLLQGPRRHRRRLRRARAQASPHADARPHPAAAGHADRARPEDRRLGVRHRPRRAPPGGELPGDAGPAVRRRLGQPVGAGRQGRAGDGRGWPKRLGARRCRPRPGSPSASAWPRWRRTPRWWSARSPRRRATSR